MTHDHEALLALSRAATQGRMELQSYDPECPGVPMIAVPDDTPVGGTPTNGLVAVATLLPVEAPFGDFPGESSRAEANARFIAALWSAYRSGDLIHRSKISEETARAGEDRATIEEAKYWLIAWAGGRYGACRDTIIKLDRMLAALPLTEEAGHGE